MFVLKNGLTAALAAIIRPRDVTAPLTLLYVLALSSIAFFNVLILLLVGGGLDGMSSDALLINHAGRQRMLSQKIVKEVYQLIGGRTPREREISRRLLADTVAIWSRVHQGLQHGDQELGLPGNLSPTAAQLFGDINPQFLEIQTAAKAILGFGGADLARMTVASPSVRSLAESAALFLPLMEAAVFRFEAEARGRVEAQKRREVLSVAAVLVLLLFEAIFIFLPLSRKVRSTVTDLRAANTDLAEDIAKRVEVEEALRKSELRYRTLAEVSLQGIVIHRDLVPLYANRVFAKTYGFADNAEVLRLPSLERLIAPGEKRKAFDNLEPERASWDSPLRFEFQGVKLDGAAIWLDATSAPIEWDSRPATLSTHLDITTRKLSENELRKSDAELKEAQQIAHLGNFEWKVTENEFYVSDEIYKILGMEKRTRLEFQDFLHALLPEDRSRVAKKMEDISRESEVFEAEFRILTRDGEVRDIHARGKSGISNGGAGTSVKGTIQDITERKELEQQIRHAQKMEAIGSLAGGIAHDFNNLLQAITGNLALVLSQIDTSHPFYEDLARISARIDSGSELTRQLLGFARGGKYVVRATSLNRIVQSTSEMFGRTHKELSIQSDYEQEIWSTQADQGQIEQVVLNLLVNAQQAMPNGGKIFLQTENVILDSEFVKPHGAKNGKFVKLTVIDTGTGIREEISHRIFDPFFTTKKTGQGFGLGLASAYGIVKNHGGIITFESTAGKGTAFNLYFPADSRPVPEAEPVAPETSNGDQTILFLDDDPELVETETCLLETAGYNVFGASSGNEALEIFEKHKDEIALVILDMIMPEMGGSEVFDRLKKINPQVKVLLSSGYTLDGQAQEIMDRGCNGFIQKPYRIEALSGKLQEIFNQK